MVQFSFFALASVLATAAAATSGRPIATKTVNLGDRKLRRGDAATDALLKKAKPFNGKRAGSPKKRGGRKLDGEEEEFEIDGTYSLQFSECVDIKTYDEDLFDEDIVSYVQAGQIVAAKSYVLFHVCQEDTCYLDAEDDLYIVDLATYMSNVAQYHANKRTDYCEQCDQFEDYCNPEEEEVEEEEEEEEEEADEEEEDEESEDNEDEEEENDEEDNEDEEGEEDEDEDRRKLKKTKRMAKKTKRKLTTRKGNKKLSLKAIERKLANEPEYIDCDQCATYECYAEEDEEENDDANQQQNQQDLDESVSEWIANLGECVETGVQWNNLDLYVGAMCSPYGDGVELAVFANDECTWYTNQKQFSDVYNYANDEDNENNVNYLTYAENFIKSAFSEVTPCLEKEYSDPDEEQDDNENEDEDEEEQEYAVNEYCQGVMEEDVVSLANCEAEEQEEEEEENDDAAANYNWFTYDMKEADDINEVCATINKMESADYSHVYDEESSGSWYERNKKGSIVTGEESQGLSGGAVAAIVAVIAGVLGAAGFFLMKAKTDKPIEADYQGGEMS